MTTEYKIYTVSKVQTGYAFFEEITDFVSIQDSLEGVKVGDKVRLGIDRSNTFGALISAEIVKPKHVLSAFIVPTLLIGTVYAYQSLMGKVGSLYPFVFAYLVVLLVELHRYGLFFKGKTPRR